MTQWYLLILYHLFLPNLFPCSSHCESLLKLFWKTLSFLFPFLLWACTIPFIFFRTNWKTHLSLMRKMPQTRSNRTFFLQCLLSNPSLPVQVCRLLGGKSKVPTNSILGSSLRFHLFNQNGGGCILACPVEVQHEIKACPCGWAFRGLKKGALP